MPSQYRQFCQMGHIIIENICQWLRTHLADVEQLRDFIYVKDTVDMTLFFMDNPDLAGLYNIGTANARNWNDLAKATFAAMNKEPQIDYIKMPEHLKAKYQYYTKADTTKLRNAGCDKETTSLDDAIKDYIQNYLQKDEHLGAD